MSNEEKLKSLKEARTAMQEKIQNLKSEIAETWEEISKLPEGKEKNERKNEYFEKLAELDNTRFLVTKINADIKSVSAKIRKANKSVSASEDSKELAVVNEEKSLEALNNKLAVADEEKSLEPTNNKMTIVNKESATEETKKTSKKGLMILGISALAGVMFFAGRGSKKNGNDATSIFGISSCVPYNHNNNTGINIETPVLNDVSNEEDVRDAANRVCDEIKFMLEKENDVALNFIATHENIEDMIRVLNGELPINSKFDENTVDKMIQLNADIFANRGHIDNELYSVKYEHFFEDGSLEAMYAKSYDELYDKIAKARQEGNIGKFIELAGELASKLYNEWYLSGLYGGFNPYLLDENKQYFALLAATSRYPNFVLEYSQNHDLAICVPTCLNDDNEFEKREINEIIFGIYYGVNQFGETMTTRNNKQYCICDEIYEKLNNSLLEKNNAQVKKLK